MKILAVVGVLLILTSCNKAKVFGVDDSTPIIVTDGSVTIHRDEGFVKHADGKTVHAMHTQHGPHSIGYKCSMGKNGDDGNCNKDPKPCLEEMVTGCRQPLTGEKAWSLDIMDGPGSSPAATLSWSAASDAQTQVYMPNGYVEQYDDLIASQLHPQRAILKSAAGQVIATFDCTDVVKGQICVSVGYKK